MSGKEVFGDIMVTLEKQFEMDLLRKISSEDALLNDGEIVYIRKVDNRLQWMKANVHGVIQDWKELTPYLAKSRLDRKNVGEVDEESLEKLRDLLAAAQTPEAYEIGWYQDVKGDLYQFDGKNWLGAVPNKMTKETFEYLGK